VKPITLSIPVHADLQAVIDVTPSGHLNFLVTERGKPFTAAGFGNWFADRCREAGVPGRAHGLRKACARRLAEAGATAHEIMAITGHVTLSEVERYTKRADQARLARSAMAKARTENGKL
jgi:integrase